MDFGPGVFRPKVVEFLMFKAFHDEDIEIPGKGNVKVEFFVDGLVISDVLIMNGCFHRRLCGHSTLANVGHEKKVGRHIATRSNKCSRCRIWHDYLRILKFVEDMTHH